MIEKNPTPANPAKRTPAERIAYAEQQIEHCLQAQKDSVLNPYAWMGELDWIIERQRLLEELGREAA